MSRHCLLALDLGTTTLVGRLLAADGSTLAEARLANPQRLLGADILTRLQRAHEGAGAELQQLLIDGIRTLVDELLTQAGCPALAITAVAVAGNPGICHLLLGLPVPSLLYPPHRTPLTEPVTLPMGVFLGHGACGAGDSYTGILVNSLNTNTPVIPADHGSRITDHEVSPHSSPLTLHDGDSPLVGTVPVTLFPAISGYVGGDLVAVLYGARGAANSSSRLVVKSESQNLTAQPLNDLTTQPLNDSTTQRLNHSTHESALPGTLVLDLGTNAEIALWTGTQWLATSVAAGPAFEAGNIACGMPLAPGAVTEVQLRGDRLELTVADGGRPMGLCGSGLLSLIAAARSGGLLDAGGRIVAPDEVGTNLARYLVANGEGWAICFYRDTRGELCLTQDDVRQLQLAKGAVRAGIEVLLDRAGLTAAEIDAVLITGAFGAALPVAAVKGIAMLPEGMIDKSFFVPDGVLDGLAAFLADPDGAAKLTKLLATIKPLPLSGTPAFEKRFLAALEFGWGDVGNLVY